MSSEYFGSLRAELVAAAARSNRQSEAAKHRGWRRRWGALLTAAVIAAPVGAVAAGVWQPWTEGDGLARLSPNDVVASGRLLSEGTWQLVRSDSSSGECLELLLADASIDKPTRAGGCGIPEGAVASIGGTTQSPGIIFGRVPAATATAAYWSPTDVASPIPVRVFGSEQPGHDARHFFLQATAINSNGCVLIRDKSGALLRASALSEANTARCTAQAKDVSPDAG